MNFLIFSPNGSCIEDGSGMAIPIRRSWHKVDVTSKRSEIESLSAELSSHLSREARTSISHQNVIVISPFATNWAVIHSMDGVL